MGPHSGPYRLVGAAGPVYRPAGTGYVRGMASGLVWDESFKQHDTGPDHPEQPARLDAVRAALERAGLVKALVPIPVAEAAECDLLRIHDAAYLARLAHACASGAAYIDTPDSAIGPQSDAIARRAAGAVIAAVEGVMAGRWRNAFCAVRPPGHHAERDRSMGFCLLNNVAIAADYLIRTHGLQRVLILDWDVHHGNGTQHSFEDRADVFFISLHGDPRTLYPGTGYAHETGTGPGRGFTLNIPMPPGAGDEAYRCAFAEQVGSAAESFAPQFVLISAGFDAHRRDPLAALELETESYAWMTEWVLDLARRHSGGRVVSVLEGGYDLAALGECAAAHVGLLHAAST